MGRARFDIAQEDFERLSRHRTGVKFSSCVTLAPAGTGTMSTWRAMTRLRNVSSEQAASTAHSHMLRAEDLASSSNCFIVTVRDPVQRLLTAFSWERGVRGTAEGAAANEATQLFSHRRKDRSPEEYVLRFKEEVRQQRLGSHARQTLYLDSMPGRQVWEVGRVDAYGGQRLMNANTFLVPAASYVAPWAPPHEPHHHAPARVEVHWLCTNLLSQRWAALVETFDAAGDLGIPVEAAAALLRHENSRKGYRSGHHGLDALSNASAAWVRTCLFPEDWALAQAAGCV